MSNDDSTAPPTLDYFNPITEPAPAGFWWRAAALLVDFVILSGGTVVVIVVSWFIIWLIPALEAYILEPEVEDLLSLALWCSIWVYFSLMESSRLQATVGKAAFRIYVTDAEGKRISFLRAACRSASKAISGGLLLTGFIAAGFTEEKQALHDLLADTRVKFGKRP